MSFILKNSVKWTGWMEAHGLQLAEQATNLRDGISRFTVQVYPRSWTTLSVPLDNVGMRNIRSQDWDK